jgi:hypothetical protein
MNGSMSLRSLLAHTCISGDFVFAAVIEWW